MIFEPVVQELRMPLNPEEEGMSRQLNCLDYPVRRCGTDGKTGGHALDGLMVRAVDPNLPLSQDSMQLAAVGNRNGMG